MTLKFPTNKNKPDNRMVEYNQEIVRLGRERALTQQELDRKKLEVDEVEKKRDLVLREITEAETKLASINLEVDTAIKKAGEDISSINSKKKQAEGVVFEKKTKLENIEKHLSDLMEKISKSTDDLNTLHKKIDDAYTLYVKGKDEVSQLAKEKLALQHEVEDLCQLKADLISGNVERENVLQYIEEKEKFLNRKEHDLRVYENRVKKIREEVGIITPMIFK
ncbi:MAG: hypothetical protein NUV80_04660 [Candidatus Berkelbacteria bacterium]|nr:hypothetical protein [Candidatus Berkelbacteria bacterium]